MITMGEILKEKRVCFLAAVIKNHQIEGTSMIYVFKFQQE